MCLLRGELGRAGVFLCSCSRISCGGHCGCLKLGRSESGEAGPWEGQCDAAHLILAPGRLWDEGAQCQAALRSLSSSSGLEWSRAGPSSMGARSVLIFHAPVLGPCHTAGLWAAAVRRAGWSSAATMQVHEMHPLSPPAQWWGPCHPQE